MAHVELSLAPEVHQSNHWMLPIQILRIGQEQHVPDSSNHSLYLIKLFNSSYPEGNSGVNQQLDGSISLSPLHPSITNDLHVSIATSLHQSFLLTLPFSGIVHHLSGPNTCALTQTTLKITVGCRCTYPHSLSLRLQVYHPKTCTHVRLLGPCFKTGRTRPCSQKRTPRIEQQQ